MERVLGVAIGIAVVCLLLSIIASHVQEVWAAYSAKRAAMLEKAVREMLAATPLAQAFFQHPLIENISYARIKTKGEPPRMRPTYIASSLFRRVLYAILPEQHNITVANPHEIIQQIPPSPLQSRLHTLTLGVQNDATACNVAVEQWYDGTMDRVNGLYKRETQWSLLLLGFLLAILCNANLFSVTEKLWTSEDARIAVTAVSEMYSCKDATQCGIDYDTRQRKMLSDLDRYLPIGYRDKHVKRYWRDFRDHARQRMDAWKRSDPRWHAWPRITGNWIYNLAGWLLTAVAVSLGAPFWFDTVNKLVNIRLAGVKPPRADESSAARDAAPV
jgi:hypothetical protein